MQCYWYLFQGLEGFKLVEKMGDGAFSNVYKAIDRTSGQKVAGKFWSLDFHRGGLFPDWNMTHHSQGRQEVRAQRHSSESRSFSHFFIVRIRPSGGISRQEYTWRGDMGLEKMRFRFVFVLAPCPLPLARQLANLRILLASILLGEETEKADKTEIRWLIVSCSFPNSFRLPPCSPPSVLTHSPAIST
jgi:serine/threonine protein kinase